MDLLRFAAAVLVMLYHFASLSLPDEEARQAFASIAPLAANGWVGVPIFFVISGFVIAMSAQGRSAGGFALGRAERLYPAAWLCATLTVIVAGKPGMAGPYISSILLSPIGPWVSGVYWTLAVELSFYALVTLVLARRGSNALPRLAIWLGSLSVTYWTVRLATEAATGSSDWLFGPLNQFAGHLLLLRSGCLFALGMLLFEARRRGWRPLVVPLVAFTLCGLGSIVSRVVSLNGDPGAYQSSLIFAPLLFLTALACLVVGLVSHPKETSPWGVIRWLGLLTYPLYLIHSEIGAWVTQRLALGPWTELGLAITASLALAALILPAEKAIRRATFGAIRRRLDDAAARRGEAMLIA